MPEKIPYGFMVLLMIMAAIFSACAPAVATAQATQIPDESPTSAPSISGSVGVVLPTKDEPRWIQDETRFKNAFTKAGYDVEILFSEGDSAKEKSNVDSLIAKGIKVLIICPQDGTAAAAAAEAARSAGVRVIAYDRLILNTAAVDYYVTFDSLAVGESCFW